MLKLGIRPSNMLEIGILVHPVGRTVPLNSQSVITRIQTSRDDTSILDNMLASCGLT